LVEYNPFWFAVLITIGVVFISMAILFGLKIAYSAIDSNGNIIPDQKPELKCLIFNDGRLAVIEMYGCTGGYETISWFLSKGYNIVASYDENGYTDEVFMSR